MRMAEIVHFYKHFLPRALEEASIILVVSTQKCSGLPPVEGAVPEKTGISVNHQAKVFSFSEEAMELPYSSSLGKGKVVVPWGAVLGVKRIGPSSAGGAA